MNQNDPRISELLEKLDSKLEKNSSILQQIVSVSSDYYAESKTKSKDIFDFLNKSIINPTVQSETYFRTDPFVKRSLNSIVGTIKEIPNLLKNIEHAIERSSAIQSALMATLQGHGDNISSLRSLVRQKPENVLSQLDGASRLAKKETSAPSSPTANITAVSSSLPKEDIAVTSQAFKGLGMFIKQFVAALQNFADVKDKVKPKEVSEFIIRIFSDISKNISKNKIEKTERVLGSFDKLFKSLINSLTYIVENAEKFTLATGALITLQSVIKGMSFAIILSSFAAPFIPSAFIMIGAMNNMALSISWIGLPLIFGRVMKGSEALHTLGKALTWFAASFWATGIMMKKYDLGAIIDAYERMIDLYGELAMMKIPWIRTGKNIRLFGEFAKTIFSSVANLSTIGSIFRKWKKEDIKDDLDSLFFIFHQALPIFDIIVNEKFKVKQIRRPLEGLDVFFSSIPYLLEKIKKVADETESLDEDTILKVGKLFQPISDALLPLQMLKFDLKKYKEVESIFDLFFKINNKIITYANKLDDKKLKSAEEKLEILNKFIIKITDIFKEINANEKNYKKGLLILQNLTQMANRLFFFIFTLSLAVPMIPLAILTIAFLQKAIQKLSKVSSEANQLTKLATSIIVLSISILTFTSSVVLSAFLLSKANPVYVLGVLITMVAFSYVFNKLSEYSENIKSGAKAAKTMGWGLILFGTGLALSIAVFSKNDFAKTMSSIFGMALSLAIFSFIFYEIGEKKYTDNIKRASVAIILIGAALASFGIGIGLMILGSGGLKPENLLSIMMAAGVLAVYAGLMWIIGKDKIYNDVKRGAIATILIGAALAVFALGIGILKKTVGNTSPGEMGMMIMSSLVLLAFATLMFFIGIMSKEITKGALVVMLIGISLAIFAVGFFVLKSLVGNTQNEDVGGLLNGAVVLGAFALLMWFVGSRAKEIAIGALVVMLIGISIGIFALGLKFLMDIVAKIPIETLLIGAAVLIAFIGGYALLGSLMTSGIGTAVMFLAIAAVAAIGLSLVLFAEGVKALSTIPSFDMDQMLNLVLLMGGLVTAYSIAGITAPLTLLGSAAVTAMSLTLPLFTEAIKGLTKLPSFDFSILAAFGGFLLTLVAGYSALGVAAILVLPGTIVAGAMANSLYNLVNAFKETTKLEWDKLPIEYISKAIVGIGEAFAIVGADGSKGVGGFISGLLNAVGIGPNNVERGIKSISQVGKALMEITEGLLEFQDKIAPLNIAKIGEGGILDQIIGVVTAIHTAFAGIGAPEEYTPINFMERLFGAKSNTERGIEAVKGIGKILNEVATGLITWSDLSSRGIDMDLITENISKVLTVIHAEFAKLGKDDAESRTFLGFGDGDITNGIDAVKGVGETFSDIAKGLVTWSDLNKAGIDIKKISSNISIVLSMIATEFANIGKNDKSGWFSDGDVTNGVEAVEGVGKIFTDIASGLKVYADLEKMGFSAGSFDPKKEGSIAYNMMSVLRATGAVFAEIGKSNSVTIEQNGKVVEIESWTKKGVESVKGVGSIMTGIANSLKAFASIDQMKLPLVKENIKAILTTIGNVFADIGKGDGKTFKSDDVKRGIEAVKGVGGELESISKSLAPYIDMQKGDKKINIEKLKKNIIDLVTTNISIIGAIGMLQTPTMESYKTASALLGISPEMIKTFQLSNITSGKNVLEVANTGMETFKTTIDIANKISGSKKDLDVNGIKKILRDIISFSAGILGGIGIAQIDPTNKIIKEAIGVDDATFLLKANLLKGIEVMNDMQRGSELFISLIKVFDGIKVDEKSWSAKKTLFQDLIKMSKNMNVFIETIVKGTVTKTQLDNTSRIVNFFERFGIIEKPFERFVKSFAKHVKDFKDYISTINSIKLDRMGAFNELNKNIVEIIKSDKNTTETNLESVKQYVDESVAAIVKQQVNYGNFMGGAGSTFSNTGGFSNTQPTTQSGFNRGGIGTQQQFVDNSTMERYLMDISQSLRKITDKRVSIAVDTNPLK